MRNSSVITDLAAQSAREARAIRAGDGSCRDECVAIVNDVESPWRVNAWRLFLLGGALVTLGGLGDIAYHVGPISHSLEPVMGAEGIRAHILTLAGMVVALTGVMGRAISR